MMNDKEFLRKTETHHEAVVAFIDHIGSNSLKCGNQWSEKAVSYATNNATNDCHDRPEDQGDRQWE